MEKLETCFFLPFDPVSKARPRLGKHGTYTPTKTKKAENQIREYLKFHNKFQFVDCPLDVSIQFFIRKPKTSKNEYPILRPDLDNYVKLIMDAFNDIVWADDSQVVTLFCSKVYSENRIGTKVFVRRVI